MKINVENSNLLSILVIGKCISSYAYYVVFAQHVFTDLVEMLIQLQVAINVSNLFFSGKVSYAVQFKGKQAHLVQLTYALPKNIFNINPYCFTTLWTAVWKNEKNNSATQKIN